ncbi:MAG: glutamate--cysteine ligase [Halobacteriaceae archaeon]
MATDPETAFTRSGTLGVEEEFYVVDEAGRPTAGTDDLVYGSDPPAAIEGRIDHELFKCVIETQTPTLSGVSEAPEAVADARQALVDHAAAHGYRIAGAGLHPGARWRELDHAEKPRYRSQLDRIQYPQHRNTTAGVHVHVGVDDPEKAVWVADEIRWHLPILLALSANSPYWNGFDTGLQSARAKIFEGLPNTGMPTAFESFEAFQQFERRMVEQDRVDDRGELWWDVRPNTEYGTVEVRAPDGQAEAERVVQLVEYVHALVTDLAARYEDGESRTPHRRELLDENKWKAMRYGREATFLAREGAGTVDLATVVERDGDRLGIEAPLALYDAESGAERQRRLAADGVDRLYDSLTLRRGKIFTPQ